MYPIVAWNWFDWVLAAIVAISIALAVRKGFVRELISLAAVVVGIVLAALWYPRAASWYDDLTKSHQIALAAGFLTIFFLTLLAGAIASIVAHWLLQKAGVEWFDRFLGAIFGLIRGMVVDSILLMVLMAFGVKPRAVQTSRLAPYVSTGARALAYLMPESLRKSFDTEFQKFRKATVQDATSMLKHGGPS